MMVIDIECSSLTFQTLQKQTSNFLGHRSHSGDLLLWVGVRRRAVCFVLRPSTSSSQELLGQS